MNSWIPLVSEEQIGSIVEQSKLEPILIFKHSTSCSISQMAKLRFEGSWTFPIKSYFLDLLSYRSISNLIAETFQVVHESPQVLIIADGECIYDESHLDIQVEDILLSIKPLLI